MNILVEGWRNINHSYALVNQWQVFELIKSSNIYFKDVSYSNKNWNSQRNDSGLRDEVKKIITFCEEKGIESGINPLKFEVAYNYASDIFLNYK